MAAEWSLLPCNLVDSVASLLSVADQARMAATCKPWGLAMADGLCRAQRKPSIWIGSADRFNLHNKINHCEFRSLSEDLKREYVIPTPAANVRVIGLSHGLVILEDATTRVHAFNPISKETLSFPVSLRPERMLFVDNEKAVLLRREGSPMMVAVKRQVVNDQDSFRQVAVAKPGDGAWSPLHFPPHVRAFEIAVHQMTLYAIDWCDRIIVYDLDGDSPESLSPARVIRMTLSHSCRCESHAGFVSGKLVLVRSRNSRSQCSPYRRRCPHQFEVLELETAAPGDKWKTMKDLAGHAILLGYDGMIAVRAEDFEELEANCVYSFHIEERCTEASLVVTNIETEAITSRPISIHYPRLPFWFLPN